MALIGADTVEVTDFVVTLNVAVVVPSATTTLAGAVAEELSLHNPTQSPPVGAGALRVTVPVDKLPPATDVGLSVSAARAGADAMVSDAVRLMPL